MTKQVAAAEVTSLKAKNHMVHQCNLMPAKLEYEPKLPAFSCTISAKGSCDTNKQDYVRDLNTMKAKAKAEMNAAMEAKKKCDVATSTHAASTKEIATVKTSWVNHPCQNDDKAGGGKGKETTAQNVQSGPPGKLPDRPAGSSATPVARRRRGPPAYRRRRGSQEQSRRRRNGAASQRRRNAKSSRPITRRRRGHVAAAGSQKNLPVRRRRGGTSSKRRRRGAKPSSSKRRRRPAFGGRRRR